MVIVQLLSSCVIMFVKVSVMLVLLFIVGLQSQRIIRNNTSIILYNMVHLLSSMVFQILSFFVNIWLILSLVLLWIQITLLILQSVLTLIFNLIVMKEKTKNFWTFVLTIAKYGIALAIGWISGDTSVINSIL